MSLIDIETLYNNKKLLCPQHLHKILLFLSTQNLVIAKD